MVKSSFLKLGLLALCVLVAPAHSADPGLKNTVWNLKTIKASSKNIFIAAWVAKAAHEYLISNDWSITDALKSIGADTIGYVNSSIMAPVGTVKGFVGMILPTTADWTLRSECVRIGSMAFMLAMPIGIAFLKDKVDESGFQMKLSFEAYYKSLRSGGFHCCREHKQEFLNPVAQLAGASFIMGAAPVVINSVISSEDPFQNGLEVIVAAGSAYFFAQSYLCKKHHAFLLLQERKNELEISAHTLDQKRAALDEEYGEIERKSAKLLLEIDPADLKDKSAEILLEIDPDLEDKSFAYA